MECKGELKRKNTVGSNKSYLVNGLFTEASLKSRLEPIAQLLKIQDENAWLLKFYSKERALLRYEGRISESTYSLRILTKHSYLPTLILSKLDQVYTQQMDWIKIAHYFSLRGMPWIVDEITTWVELFLMGNKSEKEFENKLRAIKERN